MPDTHDGASVAAASAVLASGALVVFPTESVYGLGVDAASADAVDRLLAVRGREAGKPILVLVSDMAMVRAIAAEIPPAAARLAARLWPGPLTLVLPARPDVPEGLTAGTGTIGVRLPGHATARMLVAALGRPVTAPSANPRGRRPATTVGEAVAYFGERVGAYIDGGRLGGGASTVVAIEGDRVRVLRGGLVDEATIRRTLEE
ncbi:MAG: L-threonylcarbamoyladenylate synthase [Candidatus Binatia bacterium]